MKSAFVKSVAAAIAGGVFAFAATASDTVSETMDDALTFDSATASLDHRKMTVSGVLSNFCGEASVTLWVGESNDVGKMAQVGDKQAVSADGDGSFSFACQLDSFYKTYYWQLRAEDVTSGLTVTNTATTAVKSAYPKDSTTYTMKDGVDGSWDDAANWDNNAGGDCIGYPHNSDTIAAFAANRKGRLLLTTKRTINQLNVTGANAEVTLAQGGADTNATMLSCNSFAVSGERCRLTLDGVAFKPGTDKPYLGKYSTLSLTNGACIFRTFTVFNSQRLGTVEVADKSWLGIRFFDFGPGTIVVNDATLCIASAKASESSGMEAFGGGVSLGTNAVFRFMGKSPQLLFGGPLPWLASHQDKAAFTFEFEVPAGGYESAPIRATNPKDEFTRKFGAGHLAETSSMPEGVVKGFARVVVSTNSPALKSSKTLTAVPLISWPKGGISLDFVKEFEVPDKGKRGNAFVWGDYLESDPTVPQTLGVTLVGCGMMLIFR